MMARINSIIDGVIVREGDYTDNPKDKGGPTRWGITEAVARANGWAGPMQLLPRDVAVRIYREQYFLGPRFDMVLSYSQIIGEELVDTGVNMGVTVAATFLQRSLNVLNREQKFYKDVQVDGYLGQHSVASLASFIGVRGKEGEAVLLTAINALQGCRYIELCEKREANEEFIYGWLKSRVGL